MAERPKPEPRVDSTLSKGLAILEHLAAAEGGKGVTELSRALGFTKSNTFRLLQTLMVLGYVQHGDDRTYSATLKTWQVGRASVASLNLRELAGPEMNELARISAETVYLAVPENLTVVYIDKIESQKPIRSWNPVGGSAPIYCVSTGKAILAANYSAMRDKVSGHLSPFTDRTLTTIGALDADMKQTLAQGFAFDSGEFRERVVGFGAAILLPDGKAIASLGVSMPEIHLEDIAAEEIGQAVKAAARSVSEKLCRH